MSKRFQVGNAQGIGRQDVQSNYFSTAYAGKNNLVAVVADGSIDHPNGRAAAVLAVDYCVEALRLATMPANLLEIAKDASRHVQDLVYLGNQPRLSLTMVCFDDAKAYYFNVGANKMFHYKGNTERILGSDMSLPYAMGVQEIKGREVVAILTKGAYSAMHPMERIKIIETTRIKGSIKKLTMLDKAQAIVESVTAKNLPGQQNMTVLLIRAGL